MERPKTDFFCHVKWSLIHSAPALDDGCTSGDNISVYCNGQVLSSRRGILKSTAYHWMLGLVAALGPTDTHVKYPHCPSPPLIEGSLGVYALLGGPCAGPKSGVSRLWVMVGQAYLG